MSQKKPARGTTPGCSPATFHKPRAEYDDDITFQLNILMSRFRGLAGMIETMADHTGESESLVKDVSAQLYTLADAARHFANEGDLLAIYIADELDKEKAPS